MFDHYDVHGLPQTCTGAEQDLKQVRAKLAEAQAALAEFTQHLADGPLPDDVETLRRYVQYARSTARHVDAGNKALRSRLAEMRAQRDALREELDKARGASADARAVLDEIETEVDMSVWRRPERVRHARDAVRRARRILRWRSEALADGVPAASEHAPNEEDPQVNARRTDPDTGLREHWTALEHDGCWTSGENKSRTEAEEIIAFRERSGFTPIPVLAVRRETDWRIVPPSGTRRADR